MITTSADSFHHQVEDKIRRKKYLYDFNDYVDCVDSAGKALLMRPEDIFDFKSYQSIAKDINYPNLSEISKIQLCKGETNSFGKLHLENMLINLANYSKRNSAINVWKKFQEVMQEE